MDDFFGVDVAGILSQSDNRRLERLRKKSSGNLHSLHSGSSGQLRPMNKKEEIKLFFDALFGSLGTNLSKTVEVVEKTHLTDFVYAKVRKLAI